MQELYHHGIMGMHWGKRRYQNSDGSLTPAGKLRYGSLERIDSKSVDKKHYSKSERDYSKYSYSVTGRKTGLGTNNGKILRSINGNDVGAIYTDWNGPSKDDKKRQEAYDKIASSIKDVPAQSIKKDKSGFNTTAFIDKNLSDSDKYALRTCDLSIYPDFANAYRNAKDKSLDQYIKNRDNIKKAEKASINFLNSTEKLSTVYKNMTDDMTQIAYGHQSFVDWCKDPSNPNKDKKQKDEMAKKAAEARDFWMAAGQFHQINNVKYTKDSLNTVADDVSKTHNNSINYNKYIGNKNRKTLTAIGSDNNYRTYYDYSYQYGKKSKADEIYYPSNDPIHDLRKIQKRGAYNTIKHSDDELYHYGVMGMHWGVRRYQTEGGALTPAGKERYSSSMYTGNRSAEKKAMKYARERANNPIDPETGLHLKSREMTIKEDCDRVNPLYKSDVNEIAARHNCALCSVTYSLRRKGYDVTANLQNEGEYDESIKSWFKNAKTSTVKPETKTSSPADLYQKGPASKVGKEMLKSLKEQHGDNAYGIWTMSWLPGGGHAIAWEVKNGKPYFIDAQTNTIYDERNVGEIFQYSNINTYLCMRTDNAEVNWKKSDVRAKVVGKNAKS